MSNSLSLQQKLEIEDIKEGVVVLKGDILRAVLAVSSVNFALKSLDEQKALIARYQEFLNSLDFPIEVLVTSRKYDLSEYAEMLRAQAKQQKNELLKIQTNEYVDFIKNLAEMTNIMSKNFYVVVPFAAGGNYDLTSRLVGEGMSRALGQTVIVDNRPGAGGVVGSEVVATARPDGYTLLLVKKAGDDKLDILPLKSEGNHTASAAATKKALEEKSPAWDKLFGDAKSFTRLKDR